MTAQYRVLPAADRDLDDQAAYLAAQASLDQALRFYDAASATFAKLASMPGIGERWPSTNPRLAGLRVGWIEGFEKHRPASCRASARVWRRCGPGVGGQQRRSSLTEWNPPQAMGL
jgi:toxin ParE1/3/4